MRYGQGATCQQWIGAAIDVGTSVDKSLTTDPIPPMEKAGSLSETGPDLVFQLVAGVGFEPTTFGL